MNIYAIADLHGQLVAPPPDADLLILAGDVCPDSPRRSGSYGGEHEQSVWLDTTFRTWLDLHRVETIATWGNHDFVGEHPTLVPDLPWTLLVDEPLTRHGLRFWGTPWVPGLPYWAFYGSPAALKARADLIPLGTNVLITHGPPYYFGDYIPTSKLQQNKYGNFGGEHVGDRSLNEAIRRVEPMVTLCGHIHPSRGRHKLDGEHRIENCAAVDDYYKLVENPWVRI